MAEGPVQMDPSHSPVKPTIHVFLMKRVSGCGIETKLSWYILHFYRIMKV